MRKVIGFCLLTVTSMATARAMAAYVCYADLYGGLGVQAQYSGCGPTAEAAAGNALNVCEVNQKPGTACDELETILSNCQTDTVQQPGYVCYSNLYVGDDVGQIVAGYGVNAQAATGNALNNCNNIRRPGTACDDPSVILSTCVAATLNSCEL